MLKDNQHQNSATKNTINDKAFSLTSKLDPALVKSVVNQNDEEIKIVNMRSIEKFE